MVTERYCPKCRAKLSAVRHAKLRCPQCKRTYSRELEAPNLLRMRPYRLLRRVRWCAYAICLIFYIASELVLPKNQSDAGGQFWMKLGLICCYSTVIFTFAYWGSICAIVVSDALARNQVCWTHEKDLSRLLSVCYRLRTHRDMGARELTA